MKKVLFVLLFVAVYGVSMAMPNFNIESVNYDQVTVVAEAADDAIVIADKEKEKEKKATKSEAKAKGDAKGEGCSEAKAEGCSGSKAEAKKECASSCSGTKK